MKPAIHMLLTFCLLVISSNFISAVGGDESITTLEPSEDLLATSTTQTDLELITEKNVDDDYKNDAAAKIEELKQRKSEQRSIDFHGKLDGPTANEDRHAAFRKRAKPLKNIFLGLYKNYKSTYLGNKTLTEYKNAMRMRKEENLAESEADDEADDVEHSAVVTVAETEPSIKREEDLTTITSQPDNDNEAEKEFNAEASHSNLRSSKKKRKKQRLRKSNQRRNKNEPNHAKGKTSSPIFQYDFGHGYNMSLDMDNDIVNLHLDGESLRELMHGRSFEGRGKKYEMLTRVLPLFILPFLIQSAVVPFLVTKLKLLLMKSILVGKLAIFLLIISAIKNSGKMMQTYEVAPSYWAGEPSRRSELAAAASAAAYNGYRVEGKPTAWIN